ALRVCTSAGGARWIRACWVAVGSAVGREIDVTIADLVADAGARTPTAAAELVVPLARELAGKLEEHRCALGLALERHLERRRRAVDSLRARLRDPRSAIRSTRARTDEIRLR